MKYDKGEMKNIEGNVVGLDFIMKLRPVTYHLNMEAIARFNETPDNMRLPQAEYLKASELQSVFKAFRI